MNRPNKPVRKLLGIHYVEWVLLAFALLGFIHVVPVFFSTPNKGKEQSAKSVLAQMNEEQQRFYAQNSTFLDVSRNLEFYESGFSYDKPLYRFFTRRMSDRVYSYAEPIQEYEFGQFFIFPWNRYVGLKRYVGVVVVTDRNTRATRSGICYIRSLDAEIELIEVHSALSCQSASPQLSDPTLGK